MKFIHYLIFIFSISIQLTAQKGNSYIKNFSPAEYFASDQNWGAVQDKNGMLYFANLDGVLVFNGKNWQTITLKNKANTQSIDINTKNQIFVGGENEFGKLTQLKNGKLVYQSLSDSLNKHDLDFTSTWATHCIGDEVFFCSNEKVFCYKNNKLTSFSPDVDRFHTFFKVGKHLFVREYEVGFKVYESNQLSLVEGSEIFANQRVDVILPISPTKYLVGARNEGFYYLYYDEVHPSQSKFTKIENELANWLSESELYYGKVINNNCFALGTLKNGIKLIDSTLHELASFNITNGLEDNAVNSILCDANHNLWLSLNKGISFIETNTPISFWKKPNGIEGVVESTLKFKNNLFIATDKGLKTLKDGQFINTEITSPTFGLSNSKDYLFIPTESGINYFDGNNYKLITDEYATYCSYFNQTNNLLYVGTDDGLLIFDVLNHFKLKKRFANLHAVRSIAFDKNQNCALGTSDNGAFILKSNFTLNYISEKEGLPSLTETNVFSYLGTIYFATDNGFYLLNTTLDKAIPAKNIYPAQPIINKASQIDQDIWYHYGSKDNSKDPIEKIGVLTYSKNGYVNSINYLNRIQNSNAKHFFKDSNSVYISTNQGLYKYDLKPFSKSNKLNVVLTKVWFGSIDDTLNYLENYTANLPNLDSSFNFNNNDLHIKASITSFYESHKIEFSYYLEGIDAGFKSWNSNPIIDYNALAEGHYVFHLKGRDIFENETQELRFSFTINPPWYRSVLAYSSYVLLLIIGIFVFVKLYTKRLKDKNIQLEGIITQRTQVIVEQKHLVEEKHKEITDSINYAERIQRTFLATNDLLDEHLKNYFIFFKPKDVVSGDFYWADTLPNGNFVLATADSTGHGVPGAIMSLLNITSLEKAIEHYTSPNDILNATRQTIIKRLKKDGSAEGGKDGMDCSLIVFDIPNKKLQIAAANNPIWIVRTSTNELIEIKPDKMPVGKHDRDSESFKLQIIDVTEGDIIYTLTDGFPDQFGGEKGKKFMSKNLKELLLKNSVLPMGEQKEILEATFMSWVGNIEQVDDVTVIGVKI